MGDHSGIEVTCDAYVGPCGENRVLLFLWNGGLGVGAYDSVLCSSEEEAKMVATRLTRLMSSMVSKELICLNQEKALEWKKKHEPSQEISDVEEGPNVGDASPAPAQLAGERP